MSSSADYTIHVPIPAGTRGPGNEQVSMGIPNIDERDLDCRVGGGERSIDTDEIRNGAKDHKGGEIMKETIRNASIAVGSAGMK